eukprot:INCI15258.1.p1 GENE.INCI15258.1~~INCI15258.1.p1  ORF type:complete len:141 (+),score=20.92 INCI15258.1:100-522(+)
MEYRVPRSFKLLAELEAAEKGNHPEAFAAAAPFISLGLANPGDMTLTKWSASVIPEQGTAIGERFYTLTVAAGPKYPDEPPLIRFSEKVALPGIVNDAGQVVSFKFMQWTRESSIFEALVALRALLSRAHRENAKVSGTY